MARIIVAAAAAAVVGYFTGGTAALQTFALVYGATGFLDPNKKILGPKLQDLRAPQASYGSPIAYLEGAPRLAGNIIWASEKRPIANTSSQGNKGGAGVDSTNFTYESDVLYELAINECVAVRRIWSNGKLIWSNADDATSETIAASKSATAWRDMRFYNGAADQLPDPTYEAAVGIGNAPAYRTRTTIMVEGLNLGGSGQFPVLTFEVLSEASTPFSVELLATKEGREPFCAGSPVWSLSAPFEIFVAGADTDTLSGFVYSFETWTIDPLTGNQTLTAATDIGKHYYSTMLGTTDESLFIAADALVGGQHWDVYDAAGFFRCRLDLLAQPNGSPEFSKVGNDIAILSMGFAPDIYNDSTIRRFRFDTGALAATAAAPLAKGCQSIAIGGAYVYALSTDGLTLYKSDLTTLALVETIAVPAAYIATQGYVMCDGATPYLIGGGTANYTYPLIKWDGAAWTLIAYGITNLGSPIIAPTPGIADMYTGKPTYTQINFAGGVLFSQRESGSPFMIRIRYLDQRAAIELPRLDQVVRRLCLRTGLLTDQDIDVTDLSHDVAIADGYVRAMAVTQVSSTRTTIETLMAAYLFECVEGGVLRFVRRGGAPALTIPYDYMGASGDGKAEPLPLKRLNDIEIAARVSVKYANTLNDFQDGLEAADRLVTESTAETVVEIPLGFQPGEAKKIADANTLDLAVALIQIGPVALSRKYAALEPTDVIVLTGIDGSTFRARIGKGTIGAGLYSLELALDDASVITSVASTDSDYVSSSLVRVLANTELQLLDIPILRDADDAPGFYAAFGADGVWSGAALDVSLDDVTYSKVLDASSVAVMGDSSTTLGDYTGGTTFDEINSVTVNVGAGTLSSSTRDSLLTTNENALLVGSEIIQFRDAALQSAGVYKLTGLLRGRRGTEWAIPGHVADERVVLLQTDGLRRVTDDTADIDLPRYWKAVTHGRSVASAPSQSFTDTGVGLMPFAPVDLRLNDAGDLVWHRRSRLSSRLFTTEPPLGETTEAYDVELRDGASALVQSGTVATPSFTPASPPPAGYSATVWQKSGTIGRGYPATIEF